MSDIQQWFKIFKPINAPKFRIICFPYASGGASVYREWPRFLPEYVELLSLQLPGRENRIRQEYANDIFELIDSFHSVLSQKLNLPFIFFGHSMGALIAYEYARFLKRNSNIEPIRLFLSGRSAPNVPRRGKDLNKLSDKELIGESITTLGASRFLLKSPQLLELFIRTLRADLAMVNTYQYIEGDKLTCPVTVLAGKNDPGFVAEDLDAWQCHTQGEFTKNIYPGGHLFVNENIQKIVRSIVDYI